MNHVTTATRLTNPFVDDTSAIPGWQRRLHFYSELAAIAMLPRLFAAAKDAKQPHRKFLTALAWGTLLVDGYLVYRWIRADEVKSQRQLVGRAQDAAAAVVGAPVGPGAPLAPPVPFQPGIVVMRPSRG